MNEDLLENVTDIDVPILSATAKYKKHPSIQASKHPSILTIKEKTKIQNQFCFKHSKRNYKR